jgi:hypothetical protein
MEISQPIIYKGYFIEPETEPWAIKYGRPFKYYLAGENSEGEDVKWASSIDDAKDQISEKIMAKIPDHIVELNGRHYSFPWIEEAVKFASLWNGSLYPICNA